MYFKCDTQTLKVLKLCVTNNYLNQIFMNLNEKVALYAERTEKGINVDLKALAHDVEFRKVVVAEVVKHVKETKACVWIPAFQCGSHLSELINEIALSLQVETLTTGNIKNLRCLRAHPRKVVLIKQSFHTGKELASHIEQAKEFGCDVSVFCLMAHSSERFKEFAKVHNVEMKALVFTDEI